MLLTWFSTWQICKVADGVGIIGRQVLLTLLGCWMLLKLLDVLALSKEVVLGIDLRDGREPDEALVGASSLSSQSLYRKGSP